MANTIAFPSTLRKDIDDGTANHVSFQIIGDGLDSNLFKIHLYIPPNFSLGDSANFGSIDLGMINAVTERDTLRKQAKEEGKNEADIEAIGIGAMILKSVGVDQFGAADAAMQKAGVAVNNATTLTYEGSSIRTFTLAFTLVTESAEEAQVVRVIENTFRKYMYAKKEGEYILKYPPVFRIKFMKGTEVNEFLPHLFDSYLTGMTVSYNESSNIFHADGSPVDTSIELSFQEQRQLTRDDLYSVDDVAPGDISPNRTYPPQKSSVTTAGGNS